jgi:hypothetical protein
MSGNGCGLNWSVDNSNFSTTHLLLPESRFFSPTGPAVIEGSLPAKPSRLPTQFLTGSERVE